jgi:hypothetical protein
MLTLPKKPQNIISEQDLEGNSGNPAGKFDLGYIDSRRYRYTCYRQVTRWCWEVLGREIRVVLSACAERKNCAQFPFDIIFLGFGTHRYRITTYHSSNV